MEKQVVKIDYKILRLKDLKETPGNPQKMTPVEFQGLINSMKKDGWILDAPVVWHRPDGEYQIISGHHRINAGIEAGIIETGMKVIEGISEEKALLKVVEANKRKGNIDKIMEIDFINIIYNNYDISIDDICQEIGMPIEESSILFNNTLEDTNNANNDLSRLDKIKEIECPYCHATFSKKNN
jgi:hypothetical protein